MNINKKSLKKVSDPLEVKEGNKFLIPGFMYTVFTAISKPDTRGVVPLIDEGGKYALWPMEDLRKAPLFWLDGQAIYKGDFVYCNGEKTQIQFGLEDLTVCPKEEGGK